MFSHIYNFGLILISGAAALHRRGGVPGTSITAVYGYHSESGGWRREATSSFRLYSFGVPYLRV